MAFEKRSPSTTSVVFELRLIIRTCLCAVPWPILILIHPFPPPSAIATSPANRHSWRMTVKAVQSALLGALLLAPRLAVGEDARLPYREVCRIQQAQEALARDHTNLALVLTMCSTMPNVKYSDIQAYVDAKSGRIPIPVEANGAISLPVREDLLAEDPWIVVNQPKGTMQLNWHAGLSPALARSLTNSIHYAPLMRAVRECNDVQDKMRQFFPAAPRLTMVGLKMAFRQPDAAVIIHAKSGAHKVASDALGELLIPFDEDLLAEDPLMTFTANPAAVEIVSRKADGAP